MEEIVVRAERRRSAEGAVALSRAGRTDDKGPVPTCFGARLALQTGAGSISSSSGSSKKKIGSRSSGRAEPRSIRLVKFVAVGGLHVLMVVVDTILDLFVTYPRLRTWLL